MEWLVDASGRDYPATVLMALGTLIAAIGARRQADSILRPIADPTRR